VPKRETTWVVALTPPGRGAVASLVVDGPVAECCLDRLFHSSRGRAADWQSCGRVVLGRWGAPDVGEEVVACRVGPERFEIHCHGGQAAVTALVGSLVSEGCRQMSWQEWIRGEATCALEAQARLMLSSAPTERTAIVLWDQACGALERAVDAIVAHVEARDRRSAVDGFDCLLRHADVGGHLLEPWRVVFTGRPNVGKSSLVNALLGYSRSIVHPVAGTTRDVVASASALDGWPFEFSDTAGVRSAADPLERAGMLVAERRLAAADLVVAVVDASDPNPDDSTLVAAWPDAMRVANKCDLLADTSADFGADARIFTSATSGVGIVRLQRAIVGRLIPHPPAAGEAVPLGAEQVDRLRKAREAVTLADWDRALGLLAAIKCGDSSC
jgi:tRNA modification GTPase